MHHQSSDLMTERDALHHAILLVGSVAEVAEHCDVTPQAVYKWLRVGLPEDRVLQIEEMTGGRVHRNALYNGIDDALKRRKLRRRRR